MISALFTLLLTGVVHADPKEISWDDLAPPAPAIEDPFASMPAEQIDTLRKIYRLEMIVQEDAGIAQAKALRAQMAAEGLDVDALFAKRTEIMTQRQKASEAVSDALLGQEVRLPGYLLPLDYKDGKAIEFLLVATVGACIHTPPPPPNQIVHVTYPEGFAVKGLYTPVWVSGTLSVDKSMRNVKYKDGQTDVAVSYKLEPDFVLPY